MVYEYEFTVTIVGAYTVRPYIFSTILNIT